MKDHVDQQAKERSHIMQDGEIVTPQLGLL